MALANAYTQVYTQFPEFFKKLQEGQAPDQFTHQHLKDLGYTSSNHRALIPLLKQLGFLAADGRPTSRYHAYRSAAESRRVMAEALREVYADLFVIKAKPTEADTPLLQGKFKSTHNVSDNVAKLMTSTFFALLALADIDAQPVAATVKEGKKDKSIDDQKKKEETEAIKEHPTLHYNIQIHLPATKDIEVFNAIFKSLKEHLLD